MAKSEETGEIADSLHEMLGGGESSAGASADEAKASDLSHDPLASVEQADAEAELITPESIGDLSGSVGVSSIKDLLGGGMGATGAATPTGMDASDLAGGAGGGRQQTLEALLASLPKERRENLGRLLKVGLPVVVRLAGKGVRMGEVLSLTEGAIIEFDKHLDEPLDLLVGQRCVGVGDAVKVGENFGLRLRRMLPPGETIKALGPQ